MLRHILSPPSYRLFISLTSASSSCLFLFSSNKHVLAGRVIRWEPRPPSPQLCSEGSDRNPRESNSLRGEICQRNSMDTLKMLFKVVLPGKALFRSLAPRNGAVVDSDFIVHVGQT